MICRLAPTILHDFPARPHGIRATWEEIATIQTKQDEDPTYQYVQVLPT